MSLRWWTGRRGLLCSLRLRGPCCLVQGDGLTSAEPVIRSSGPGLSKTEDSELLVPWVLVASASEQDSCASSQPGARPGAEASFPRPTRQASATGIPRPPRALVGSPTPSGSSTHFLIGLFVIFILSCMSYLYILEINPLSVASFANIFSLSEGFLFILFMVSFAVQKLLSLIRSYFFIFAFIFIILGGG